MWEVYTPGTSWRNLVGQIYTDAGVAQGAQLVISDTANNAQRPSVAGLSGGGFAVGWDSTTSSSGTVFPALVRTRAFSAAGVAQGTETVASAAGASESWGASLAAVTSGGYVVTWTHYPDHQVQAFTASGGLAGTVQTITNTVAQETTQGAAVAGGAGGGFLFAWQSYILVGSSAYLKVRAYSAH